MRCLQLRPEMTNNYLKVSAPGREPQCFFFRDSCPESTAKAWRAARRVIGNRADVVLGVWRSPQVPGPWERLQVIGPRVVLH